MNDISTGASNDIERASNIAREMVTRYGMSEVIGPINYGGDNHEVFIGRDYGHVKNYSEETAAKIDEEVSRIVNDAYKRTEKILSENMDKLRLVAISLMEREKIYKDEFVQLMEKGFIDDNEDESVGADTTVVETADDSSADANVESTSDSKTDNDNLSNNESDN
jgi:cell division protease FtsH